MMQAINPEQAVIILNSLLELDKTAITNLITKHRVTCNENLAVAPYTLCGKDNDGHMVIGLLGVLNSIFGIQKTGAGYIAATIESSGQLGKFFVQYDDDDIPF